MVDKKQQEMQQEIRDYMGKKDYYDILGISKTASDSQIKKAYRTLALRFHPDKNQAEGAKQVFKKVSNSYSTLIDTDKRRHYDQFGPEQDRQRPQYQRAGRPGQDFEYQEFEDIFQAFFGGIPRHHGHHGHHGHRQNFRGFQFNNFNRGGQQQQEGGFNFYYILIIFFVVYTMVPLFKSSPNYSTSPTYDHRIRRTTSKLNVEYFVNNNFMQEARNYQYLKRAEMEIDRQFLLQLQQKCEHAKNQKRTLQIYAYQHRQGRQRQNYLNRAKNQDMTACRYLQQLSNTHEDYIRQLTYMRY